MTLQPFQSSQSVPAAPRNNLIAVASGKGGVGKTWLSITLAHLMQRSGRSVLLFDGDLGLANIDIQLGLTPQKDLSSVIAKTETLEQVIQPYADGGFHVIAGRSGTGGLANLGQEGLENIGAQLLHAARNYDYVILDLGAGIEQHVQYLAALAARCIVVVTDEPTSLTDAYAFIKISQQMPHKPQINIVVNQCATQKDGDMTYHNLNKACINFLHFSPPCLGVVRKDNKVREAIRSQKSLLIKAPHTTAATDVAALSIKLMQK